MLNLVEEFLVVSSCEWCFCAQQGICQDADGPNIDSMRVGMIQNFGCHVKFGANKGCQLLERTKPVVGVVPARETKVNDANVRQALFVLVGACFEEKVFELPCRRKQKNIMRCKKLVKSTIVILARSVEKAIARTYL